MTFYSLEKLAHFSSCDECQNRLVINRSFLVCSTCGLVHERIIKQPIASMHEKQQLMFYLFNRRTTFKATDTKDTKFNRLLKYDNSESEHQKLAHINSTLKYVFSILELPYRTRLRTIFLLKLFFKKNIETTTTQLAIIALNQALKEDKIIVSFDELIDLFQTMRKKTSNVTAFRVQRALNSKVRLTVKDYVHSFNSKLLETYPDLKTKTKEVFQLAELKRFFQGKNPKPFAVACLYIAYKPQKITVKKLRELFTVAEFTVRETRKEIEEKLRGDSA